MAKIDEYELTEINETLAALFKMNEGLAGDLMVYHAITKNTSVNYQLVGALERIEILLSNIEMHMRSPERWPGP
jgi:hypothetical protein